MEFVKFTLEENFQEGNTGRELETGFGNGQI